ncbi:MAG TPA: protein kinase [Verrucomicrobiota bacterium]|nr:protein kinase [Verrucomicrobiota bacterium]HNU49965.1 protein kinase [Verrucomicrobiota bacterium]
MNTPTGVSGERDGPPPVVPEHVLVRRIGRGSFGEVWLGHTTTGAWRAVKCVRRAAGEDQRLFEREFEGLRAFEPISRTHPGCVNILQAGRDDQGGFFYYVMELADDEATGRAMDPARYRPRTVQSVLKGGGRVLLGECVRIGLALAGALEHVHTHGLVHRDIKPSNIIFVRGQPKLADIGLVASADSTVTFVGTEGYVPPEGPGTVRADLYSLGKVLYELSTGLDRRDFPDLPSGVGNLPDRRLFLEINAVVNRACARDPRDRHSSAADLRHDLERIVAGQSVRRVRLRREHRVLLGALGLAVATGVISFILGRGPWRSERGSEARGAASVNETGRAGVVTAESVVLSGAGGAVVDVRGRGRHSVAVTRAGQLLAWGDNSMGQLGTGDHTGRPWPTVVGQGTNWVSADAGDSYTMGLQAEGTIWTWGGNSFGELGDGSEVGRALPARVGSDRDWAQIQAGQHNAYAVKRDGSWWGWGRNDKGQLFCRTDAHARTPIRIADAGMWSSVSVNYEHAVAIRREGGVWTWGDAASGRLGRAVEDAPAFTPGLLLGDTGWKSVHTGFGHAAALREDGVAWLWGWNAHGQLGLGDTRVREVPHRLGTESNWVAVCTASEHTLALKRDGTLWAWGAGNQGEIGDGARLDRFAPVKVNEETDWVWVPPTAGNTSFAMKKDGSLWGWGFNRFGQLGDGTFETRIRPVPVLPRQR